MAKKNKEKTAEIYAEARPMRAPSGASVQPRIQAYRQDGYVYEEAIYIDPQTGAIFHKCRLNRKPIEEKN